MTIERIDLLIPPAERAGYGVLPSFTQSMAGALSRRGVACRLLGRTRGPTPDLVQQILRDPPDFTLSFNGLLPDANGQFLCDQLAIPHVACIMDAPNHFLDLAKSPLTHITCIDRDFAAFFQGLKQQKVLFLPHAVDRDYAAPLDSPRPYQVALFGTCIDYEERRDSWRKLFPDAVRAVLEDAVSIAESNPTIAYFQALQQALEARLKNQKDLDPRSLDYFALFENLEFVIRGKDRVALVRSIKGAEVHVFGTKSGSRGWEDYLMDCSRDVTVHGRLTYNEVLATMAKTSIVLNSCPSIRNGAHERIFAGLMAGATVLTNDNQYVREQFGTEKGVVYFNAPQCEDISALILQILSNDENRRKAVVQGRALVQSAHTWDHRARKLLDHLNAEMNEVTIRGKKNQFP